MIMLGFVEHEAIMSSYVGSSTKKQKFSKLVLFEIHIPNILMKSLTEIQVVLQILGILQGKLIWDHSCHHGGGKGVLINTSA